MKPLLFRELDLYSYPEAPSRDRRIMSAHILQAAIAGLGAVLTALGMTLATVTQPDNWWEAGPWVLLVGSMGYALLQLWKTIRILEAERTKRDAETIERQRISNERLAEAIERLSELVKEDLRRD